MEILGLINIPIWILSVVILLVSLFLYSKWKHSLWKNLGIPGPPPMPFMGIMRTYFKKGSAQTDLEIMNKYGPVVGVYNCHEPVLLVSDPDMLKEIFVKEFSTFAHRSIPVKRTERMESGVALATGMHWKFLRNTISPTFTISRLKEMTKKVQKCCRSLVENIKTQTEEGKQIEAKHLCECYTMDVIATTAFGIEVNSQKDPNNKFVYYGRKAAIGSLPKFYSLIIMIFPFLKNLFNANLQDEDVNKFFRSAIRSAVNMRNKEEEGNKDFLQLMINARHPGSKESSNNNNKNLPSDLQGYKDRGLNELELQQNAILFFLAGYDTTANTLSFACHVLATHPEIQKRLVNEIDTELKGEQPEYESLAKLDYLERFLFEVLRLYGPATRFGRDCLEDITIKGVTIPKGTSVNVPVFALHRNPKFWPEPEKFDPDRFTEENKAKRPEFSYVPFGIGPRICIGMRLALLEAKLALIYMLQNYEITACENTEVPITFGKAFILRAENGVYVNMKPRMLTKAA